jgi:hypothetical protein
MPVQPNFHLLRTKIPMRMADKLREVCTEADVNGVPATMSDIVRGALADWFVKYEALRRLEALETD